MSKDRYRFIHLSDIHFGQEHSDGTRIVHSDVRDMLLRDCAELITAHGNADGILVTGDIAFAGIEDEYRQAGRFLSELAKIVGCEPIDIKIIPGNHDIDRSKVDHFCKLAHETIRRTDPTRVDAELEKFMRTDEANNPLLPKIAEYRRFAVRYGCDFPSVDVPRWRKDYSLGKQYKIALLGMNSVQVCDKDDGPEKLMLGNLQYIFQPEDNVAFVSLIHHPLNWLRDRPAAKNYLKRAAVAMFGHEHDLDIHKIESDTGSEQVVIYAGAVTPPENSADYPYRYNWIEFALGGTPDRRSLRFTAWPRIWSPSNTQFVADQNRLRGAVSKSFDVACPTFIPEMVTVDESPAFVAEQRSHQERDEMEQTLEKSFERLTYFFWEYLDWQERIKALVKIDVLPDTHNQPVAQTFERLALETARRKGSLAGLWDIVMEHVPESEKRPNPFRT